MMRSLPCILLAGLFMLCGTLTILFGCAKEGCDGRPPFGSSVSGTKVTFAEAVSMVQKALYKANRVKVILVSSQSSFEIGKHDRIRLARFIGNTTLDADPVKWEELGHITVVSNGQECIDIYLSGKRKLSITWKEGDEMKQYYGIAGESIPAFLDTLDKQNVRDLTGDASAWCQQPHSTGGNGQI